MAVLASHCPLFHLQVIAPRFSLVESLFPPPTMLTPCGLGETDSSFQSGGDLNLVHLSGLSEWFRDGHVHRTDSLRVNPRRQPFINQEESPY